MSFLLSHTYRWMMRSFLQLVTLQLGTKLQKCIRMGITVFKIFIKVGISSDIRSEITFHGFACSKINLAVYPTIYLPK